MRKGNLNFFFCFYFFCGVILFNFDKISAQETILQASLINNAIVVTKNDSLFFTNYKFNDAREEWTDFDYDGADELVIIDRNTSSEYFIYIFLLLGELKLVDSLFCGATEPYVGFSDELLEPVIFSGYPQFEKLAAKEEEIFSPLRCCQFDGEKFININDRLYQVFMEANENLFAILQSHFINSNKECELALRHKALLASIYVNYLNAGENSLAKNFIDRYYPCNDKIEFTEFLNLSR